LGKRAGIVRNGEMADYTDALVDPADPSWNLLLSELRKPGAIVENGGQDYDASDTQRQTWSR